MSILIKGMEMPKKENVVILISTSGDVWMIGDMPNEDTRLVKAKAVPVPPHGRLGDLDELYASLKKWLIKNRHSMTEATRAWIRGVLEGIAAAPTIIEAEEGET